ncbi:MAG TPA: lysylphosphatidylglycerol synthase domain-containing protein [Coleofasciculaceae cyanobacterium]
MRRLPAHWLPALLGITLFVASLWAINQELQQDSPAEILRVLRTTSKSSAMQAIGLTALNYGVMTGYDALAVRSVGCVLPFANTALTAVISYGISNTVGLALLSSSAIRYRFYSGKLSPLQIAQVSFFCHFSFWLGLCAVAGGIFLLQPVAVPAQIPLPFTSVQPLGIGCLAVVGGYASWNFFSGKALRLGHWVLPHVPMGLCLGQIAIAALDWLLAAMVLYVLLPGNAIAFASFFGIYLLAQIAGIFSNVPGGLGVFETVMLLLLSPAGSSAALLGVLLVYRGIYYFLPLIVGLVLLGWYEVRGRQSR